MRPILVKAYGALCPVPHKALEDVLVILEQWFITDAAELEGDMLKISFEGDYFPDEEVIAAIVPYLTESSQGKLDIMNLENWTLHRYQFKGGKLRDNTATLDKAIEATLL